MERYKYVKGYRPTFGADDRDHRLEEVISNGTSPHHMAAVAHLTGGTYQPEKHRAKLPHPMTGEEIRRALGVLWRGCYAA